MKSILFVAASFMTVKAVMGHTASQAREISYSIRQLQARAEDYPNSDTPSCAADYDTYDAATGICECGPGRVQASTSTCEEANDGGSFNERFLTKPQPFSIAITWSAAFTGPGDVLTPSQCGAICSEHEHCLAYLLQPAPLVTTAYCWLIGGSEIFDSPTDDGFPFFASGGDRMSKRAAAGQVGSVGDAGDVLGIQQFVSATNPDVGCVAADGDVASADLSGCDCGPGRVNTSADVCAYAPSAAARLARRSKRDVHAASW